MFVSSGNGFAVPVSTKKMSTSETKSKPTLAKSPCVGICVLDKERVRCIGCGRTIEEIINCGKKSND